MSYTIEQQRSHIRELQAMLHGISYYNPAIPRVIPDGIYGKTTADAVRAFQQYYGLRQTGEADPSTWEKVAEVYRDLIETVPEPLDAFPNVPTAQILSGDRGFTVLVIQSILHELSQEYGDIPDCPLSGVFDADTIRSLQPFQKLSGLTPTNTVDCKTWNMLASAANGGLLLHNA